jgi:hypothetical protein
MEEDDDDDLHGTAVHIYERSYLGPDTLFNPLTPELNPRNAA